ncbi:MAG: protease HtpX [Steroidobacteraceae bacterium]
MKRIVLFILTNLAILLMLTVIARITGLDLWLARRGSNLATLLVLALLFGFAGSLISLAISKWMAVRTMGVRLIEQPSGAREQWLIDTVHSLAVKAGVGVPAVGVFESPQPNAFATGPRRDRALVAVSSGLLQAMDAPEVEAVLGHEITHVANGDMVTLALIQGVLNTFVILISWLVGNIVDRSLLRDNAGRGIGYMASVWITQIVLGILATMLVMWFSRRRELRADAGGARLAGRERMIAALMQLERAHSGPLPAHMDAFGISGGARGGWARLFMSHPPIEERIAALRDARVASL